MRGALRARPERIRPLQPRRRRPLEARRLTVKSPGAAEPRPARANGGGHLPIWERLPRLGNCWSQIARCAVRRSSIRRTRRTRRARASATGTRVAEKGSGGATATAPVALGALRPPDRDLPSFRSRRRVMDAGERGLAVVSRRRPGRLLERAVANIEACPPLRPAAAKAEAPPASIS